MSIVRGALLAYPRNMTSGDTDGDAWDQALAAELRAEMGRQRLTLDEYASRSGIPKVSVERYVNGKRGVPMRRFPDLCRGLGLPMEEMLNRVVTSLNRPDERGAERRSS